MWVCIWDWCKGRSRSSREGRLKAVCAGHAGAADERMMQLMRMMNRLLDKAPETRRRHLSFHTPVIVPIWPQARSDTCSTKCLRWHRPVTACRDMRAASHQPCLQWCSSCCCCRIRQGAR